MKLTIPFGYRASVIRKRCQNANDAFFRDAVEVEIPECSSAEAPVAFRWMEKHARSDFEKSTEVRQFEGALWKPQGDYLGGSEMQHLPVEYLLKTLEPDEFLSNPFFGRMTDIMKHDVADPSEFRFFDPGEHEQERTNVLETCNNLLLIDGMVWSRTEEPCYVMSKGGWSSRFLHYQIRPLFGENEDRRNIFNALEFDDMVAHYLKTEGDIEGIGHADDCIKIEVLIPEAVKMNLKEAAIKEAIDEVLSCDDTEMKSWPTPRLIEWAGVRDSKDSLSEGDYEPEKLEELANKAHGYAHAHLRDFYLDRFEAVFDRFEALEVDFHHPTSSLS